MKEKLAWLKLVLCDRGLALVVALCAWCLIFATIAKAEGVPIQAKRHHALLVRESRAVWGLDAPVATFAAQIHQESKWNELAVSPVGAQGLAQFMPSTSRWLPSVAPETGAPMPFSPAWSIRALVTYDRWLWKRIRAASDCDRMAMTLCSYNGGLGWVQKDQRLAESVSLNPLLWTHVALVNSGRNNAAFRESRGYPTVIIHKWQPLYKDWGPGVCNGFE